MLPVQDVVPSRTRPWTTILLVGLLSGILILELSLSEPAARRLIVSYGLVPAHLWWPSLLTSTVLHYGLFDAAANMLALWIFGDNVEDRLGRGRYLALLAAGAAAAGLAALRVDPDGLTLIVGAAGAVGAAVGAHLVLLPASRVFMLVPIWRGIDLVEVPAALIALGWFVLAGLVPGVRLDRATGLTVGLVLPMAGLAIGAALGRLLVRRDRLRCSWWNLPTAQFSDRRRTSRETSASSVSSASN